MRMIPRNVPAVKRDVGLRASVLGRRQHRPEDHAHRHHHTMTRVPTTVAVVASGILLLTSCSDNDQALDELEKSSVFDLADDVVQEAGGYKVADYRRAPAPLAGGSRAVYRFYVIPGPGDQAVSKIAESFPVEPRLTAQGENVSGFNDSVAISAGVTSRAYEELQQPIKIDPGEVVFTVAVSERPASR